MTRASPWHLALLAVVALAVVAGGFGNFDPASVAPYSDYWDYLQLGRQLHSGQGFTSLFSYPLFLGYSATGDAFPLLWRPPVQPLLVAVSFFFTGGPSPLGPILIQVAGYLGAVAVTYFLALEFLTVGWAFLAALVIALSADALGLAEPGVATVPYGAALAFGVLLIVRAKTRRRAAAAGAFFGVLMLFRGEAILFLPAVMWMLWAGDRGDRESRIWIFIGAALLLLIPWTIRVWIVTGRPFFGTSSLLFTGTETFPGWESSRSLDTLDRSAIIWAVTHPADVLSKTVRNLYHYLVQALLLPLPVLAPFVWAALGRLTRVGRESAYCAGILIAMGVFILLLSPLQYAPRFLHPFLPLTTIVGFIVLSQVREQVGGEKGRLSRRIAVWVAGAVVALATLQMAGDVTRARRDRAAAVATWGPLYRADWASVAGVIGSADFALADYPAYYAWRTSKSFVWYPVAADLPRLQDHAAGRRPVVLATSRGAGGSDPTGIEPSLELGAELMNLGWRDAGRFGPPGPGAPGPVLVLTGPPASSDARR